MKIFLLLSFIFTSLSIFGQETKKKEPQNSYSKKEILTQIYSAKYNEQVVIKDTLNRLSKDTHKTGDINAKNNSTAEINRSSNYLKGNISTSEHFSKKANHARIRKQELKKD